MGRQSKEKSRISRRSFLRGLRWAPMGFLPAPLLAKSVPGLASNSFFSTRLPLPFADYRITPHYPKKSSLEDMLRYVAPGTDQYKTELYASEISAALEAWSTELRTGSNGTSALAAVLGETFQGTPLTSVAEKKRNPGYGLELSQRTFADRKVNRLSFLAGMRNYLAELRSIETAEFQITNIRETSIAPLRLDTKIRYVLAGMRNGVEREERIGYWKTEWVKGPAGAWQATMWTADEEAVSRAQPMFMDVSTQALGQVESYQEQLLGGVDYWRTVLDGATGIDVYGNNGVAAGDYDGDGFDDLYVCQPAGLPNRLYRNRGDGTFEDVTDTAGVGVLDGTACALFADFENKGVQDLLVVCANGPLLFVNQGSGRFSLKREAFRFAKPPEGTFTHAAVADYDGDGRLDIYFCLYSYYLGLDQYHYPAPYFDARNGPPNFLLHNEGNGVFEDRTQAAGLNAENDRYSFACAWNDYNGDGHPDLYVANDFGRSNLYRNNGNGTFSAVSSEAHVNDVGAGMSASWLDYNNTGKPDIYVSNMWSAAGSRVTEQAIFHEKDSEEIRANYSRHMRGNWMYRNLGNGTFENATMATGTGLGRWAWSSDSWDFDHDGYPDIYVANGYISGPGGKDVSSFFWRQVVGNSPAKETPEESYERGWNAINELIRSDATWNGYERNVFYRNNQDGTFSEVSGVSGLDFAGDSRAFTLADLDGDGRLELVLKNRTAPQLRILRNAMAEIGNTIAFRLTGTKSNRDAIGAAVTVEAKGLRQTKQLQAGSGFLSEHSKELFFGTGKMEGTVRANIRWPSGLTQVFESLPIGHSVAIQEGSKDFQARPFRKPADVYLKEAVPLPVKPLPENSETWLIQPLRAPDFSLKSPNGEALQLSSLQGYPVLLQFWGVGSSESVEQLRQLEKSGNHLQQQNVRVVCVNADSPQNVDGIRALLAKEKIALPVLLADDEVAGVYNIFIRYLFDRRRDLRLPTAFLLNREGMVVKVYQGEFDVGHVSEDVRRIPEKPEDLQTLALPMKGTAYLTGFQRNDFTYGVAFFQRGYLDAATAAFRQVIAAKPDNPEAQYNLGTLYLTKGDLQSARDYLEQAVKLKPDYAEGWNNLGMVSAQQGHEVEAVADFKKSLELRPTYVTALLNYGNLLRRKGELDAAETLLAKAVAAKPDDADANYSMGMLLARKDDLPHASEYLEKALKARPDYADALNNLGVLLVKQEKYAEAKEKFETCIRVAPQFDQAYLNLARLYMLLNEKEKAREALQELLKQQPGHKLAQQALEMLN
jgi:tetratricopeptide (TPR) repeat protein/peroxiredoxin